MVNCRSAEVLAQSLFIFFWRCERNAARRADIDTGIALDAFVGCKYSLHITVEATLGFLIAGFTIKTQFYFQHAIGQGFFFRCMRHSVAQFVRNVAVITPLMDAHFLANEGGAWREAILNRFAVAKQVNGNSGLMTMRYRSDNVFRTKCSITTVA